MNQRVRFLLILLALVVVALSFYLPANRSVDGFTFTLPDNITQEDSGNQTISFYCNDALVGGLIQFDSPNYNCLIDPTPYAEEILSILKAKGVSAANNPEFDRIMSSGLSAPDPNSAEIWIGNSEVEYMHYLFFTETQGYDLWFDLTQVSEDVRQQILDSCVVES